MVDPLAEVVTLLQPGASFSKIVSGAGPWRVRRSEAGRPFYGVILEGSCRLAVDGHESITLQAGDFVEPRSGDIGGHSDLARRAARWRIQTRHSKRAA
jgi:hypothetical protein